MFYMLAIRAIKFPVTELGPPRQRTSHSAQPKTARLVTALLWAALAATWRADAATNTFNFSPTTLAAEAGPANPANGTVAIAGATLTAGDMILFDGIVANVNGTTGDNWGSVNLNAGGYLGLTGANLGVLLRTGTGAYQCQIYTNGVAGLTFPGTSEIRTNRVVISLFVSRTGSTTNLGYRAQIDQGLTGSFTSTLSGTNLTFPGNNLALTFSAHNAAESFVQNLPLQGIHLQLPHTNLLAGAADQSVATVDYSTVSNVAPIFNPGFVYSSSDTNVVTVSSQGLLQAQGNGTATITLTASTLSDSKTVTVITNSGALQAVRLIVTNQMPLNGTQQAGVRGDFVNVADVDLLSYGQPMLVPANSNLLTVSISGLVAAIGPGITTLAASYGGLTNTKTLTVVFPTNHFVFDTFGDAFWTVVNQANGQTLVVNSTAASQSVYTNGATDQQFELLYNYQNSTFRIRQHLSWLCIGPRYGSSAVGTPIATLSAYAGITAQQWYFVDVGGGNFRIVSASSGLAMQTDNGSPASVTMASVSTNPAQYWSFVYQTHYPKKGCAGYEGECAQFGLNWAYNYDDHTGTSLPAQVVFEPMIWGPYWEPLSHVQGYYAAWHSTPQPLYLMTFNEPDNSGQANMSTNAAISMWPSLQNLNVPLVSPAMQNTYDAWAYNFFNLIAANNYRVDYTAVHLYVPPNASSLINNLNTVYATWGRPVWLTEFSPVDWSNTQSWSEQDNFNFLAEFMWLAEDQIWFKRYAIFPFAGTPSTNPWDVNGHRGDFFLADGATLTPYGELYAAWDANRAIQARAPYFIHNLATSFRLTSTNSSSAPLPSSIRARDASTQWALLPAVASNRWYVISLKDGRRLRNTGGALNLSPVGATGSAVEWWFNGPDSKGYYYIDNLAASQSLKASGTAPAITFGMVNDPAPSSQTQWRLVKPYQPVIIVTASPPAASVTSSNQSANLTWTGNGSFYNIYRGTAPGVYTKIVSVTTNTAYLDSTVQNGTAYYYVVTALNILGEESAYSAEVVAGPASTTVLPLSFAVLNNGLQFNWPTDHTGWRLQVNTDLSAPGGWITISNSAATNVLWLSFDPAQSNVFFRLVFP